MYVKKIIAALSMFASVLAWGQATKCVDASGKTTYQDGACSLGNHQSNLPVDKVISGGKKVDVSDGVVRDCYEGYRIRSLDPSKAEYLGHTASVAPAGFPVLHVSAVFRNKYGGPDRRLLWCKLTSDLNLDKFATEKAWRGE